MVRFPTEVVPYDLDFSPHAGAFAQGQTGFSNTVSIPGASWHALNLEDVVLGPDDYIEVTSLADGGPSGFAQIK